MINGGDRRWSQAKLEAMETAMNENVAKEIVSLQGASKIAETRKK